MCETESEWNAWQNIDWLFACCSLLVRCCCCCCCNDGLPADLSAVNKTHSTFLFQGEATLIEFREEHRSMFGHYICSFAIHMFLFSFNAGGSAKHKFKCMPCFCYLNDSRFELLVFAVCVCVLFGKCSFSFQWDIGFTGVHEKKNHTQTAKTPESKNREASKQSLA